VIDEPAIDWDADIVSPQRWIGARRQVALAIFGALLATYPARAAFVVAVTQICEDSILVGPCETGTPVRVPGTKASVERVWSSAGYSFSAQTDMTANYGDLYGSARVGGFDNPVVGGTKFFFYVLQRVARSFGYFDDVLTAGTGGEPGFFRIPLHVTGATSIGWQNGFGSVSLSFDCVSSVPGSALAIGHCPQVLFSFSGDEYFDTVVNLDVPIVLGAPFDFQVSAGITATNGHGYDDLIPFEGHAGGGFAARIPHSGASVLDASGTVIPNAPISASESGTVYAPEPISVASGAAALGAIGALALRARRTQLLGSGYDR
jgi:hypothetical protein